MTRRTRNIIIALMLIVVIVPIIPLVLWSFAGIWPYVKMLPEIVTTSWQRTLANKTIVTAMGNSFKLILAVLPISLACSFFAAKIIGTKRFRGRRALQLLLLVPSFIPQISLVFGMQRVFAKLGLYNNFPGLVVAMLVFYVPYMTLLLSGTFETYDTDYEDQARTLGAGPRSILWRVTIPQIRGGLIVALIFSFIGCWSAYLVVGAIAPPTFKTMSMVLFPMINSASNGYAMTACAAVLYILPIFVVLIVFSKVLVNDTDRASTKELL